MNEKSLEVVGRYELNVYRVSRGRGGMLLHTDKGIKLMLECTGTDAYYERENMYSGLLYEKGFKNIDTYYMSKNGNLIEEGELPGRRYIIKNWFDGRECDVTSLSDILKTVSVLARLHICMDEIVKSEDLPVKAIEESQLMINFEKHTRQIKSAWNYLKHKKKRCEFEQLVFKNISEFYDEAIRAMCLLKEDEAKKCLLYATQRCELCHGDFNYHNVIFTGKEVAVTNFGRVRPETQIWDLYSFMRKILEKYGWNIELAYNMIDEYNKQKPLTEEQLRVLYILLSYPEKFWKIINYYMNKSKAWIPQKNTDKLEALIKGQKQRWEFLATTGVL